MSLDAFHAAYGADPDWAVANLTTWLVYLTAGAVIANVGVVIAAFAVQNRQIKQEKICYDSRNAKLHLAALQASKNAVSIYDSVFGRSEDGNPTSSRSDLVGRMKTVARFLDYYLQREISESAVVYALISTSTLIERARLDVETVPPDGEDRIPLDIIHQICAHRKILRDGVEKIIDAALLTPVGDAEISAGMSRSIEV